MFRQLIRIKEKVPVGSNPKAGYLARPFSGQLLSKRLHILKVWLFTIYSVV